MEMLGAGEPFRIGRELARLTASTRTNHLIRKKGRLQVSGLTPDTG